MVSDMADLEIQARLDTAQLEAQEAEWYQRLVKLNGQIDKTERNMERVVRSSWGAITATVGAARGMAAALGVSFPPIFDAIMTAVTQTVYSLQSIAAAYAAGVVTAPLTATLEMAAISLSIAAVAYTAVGQQKVAQDMQRVNNALRGWGTATRYYGTVYESWQNT